MICSMCKNRKNEWTENAKNEPALPFGDLLGSKPLTQSRFIEVIHESKQLFSPV